MKSDTAPISADDHVPITATEEWRRNWTLVVATFTGYSFLSLMTGSLPVFIQPIGDEFGWSRTLVASGFSIASIFTALLSPPIGILVDRYGSRRIGLPGIVVTVLAISAFSFSTASPMQWYAMWVIYAVISISVKTTVWTSAVTGTFVAAQGLALGLTFCGTAAAQAILPPLATWLIETRGWREAYVWLAFGWGGVTLVVCWLFLRDPVERRRKAAAADRLAGRNPAEATAFPGLTIPQAWRSWTMWRIAISTFLIMAVTMGLSLHQIAILTEAGVTRMEAAWLATLAGIAGIVGKLVTGVLLDRFPGNWVGGLTIAATAPAFALLLDGIATVTLIVIGMTANGYTQGAKMQINGYLTARHAGMRNFGAIYGFMNAVIAGGAACGPIIAGLAYDSAGHYGGFLIAGTVASILCGALLMSLPAYPDWPRQADKAA